MPTRLAVMLHRRKSARAAVGAVADAPRTAPMSAMRLQAVGKAAESIERRASAKEDDPAVIHVRFGRSRGDEVAQSRKKTCRIVVMEQGQRIKTEASGSRKGGFVDERAGRVARSAAAPVRAVRVGRERGYGVGSPQGDREGEG